MAAPYVIGLEGPSNCGKSTLAANLVRELQGPVLALPCYVDAIQEDQVPRLPPFQAGSIAEQLEYLQTFVGVDYSRLARGRSLCRDPRVVVADRTWLTLLAHTFAVERRGGPASYAQARAKLLQDKEILQPDVVLLLRVGREQRANRASTEDNGTWFTRDDLNEDIYAFYDEEAESLPVHIVDIDANGGESDVLQRALRAIAA